MYARIAKSKPNELSSPIESKIIHYSNLQSRFTIVVHNHTYIFNHQTLEFERLICLFW